MSKRVVVTDHPFDNVLLESEIAERLGATFTEHFCSTEEETVTAVRGADVVLVNLAPITAEVLRGLAPKAVIIRYGIGYDNIDMDAAREYGIRVANITDYGSETVADHAAALLLSLLRRLGQYDRAIRYDGWCSPLAFGPIASFGSLTIGLVGTGRIGLSLIDRLRGFGFNLVAHDPYINPEVAADRGVQLLGLQELLACADAVSLHLPLNDGTHHLINRNALDLMKPRSVLINTSRGGLVDSDALADALADGRLAGAAIDVFEIEPLPATSRLREISQVILTPHVAFYSDESMENLQRSASEELEHALLGMALRSPVS